MPRGTDDVAKNDVIRLGKAKESEREVFCRLIYPPLGITGSNYFLHGTVPHIVPYSIPPIFIHDHVYQVHHRPNQSFPTINRKSPANT